MNISKSSHGQCREYPQMSCTPRYPVMTAAPSGCPQAASAGKYYAAASRHARALAQCLLLTGPRCQTVDESVDTSPKLRNVRRGKRGPWRAFTMRSQHRLCAGAALVVHAPLPYQRRRQMHWGPSLATRTPCKTPTHAFPSTAHARLLLGGTAMRLQVDPSAHRAQVAARFLIQAYNSMPSRQTLLRVMAAPTAACKLESP